jgi:high-affinity nickel-transport protein
VRKIFYNITITSLSVIVALLIGAIELLSVLAQRLSLSGQPWQFVSDLDLNSIGYAIFAAFALTWFVSLAVWRFARIEEKWQAKMREADA